MMTNIKCQHKMATNKKKFPVMCIGIYPVYLECIEKHFPANSE